MSAPLTPEQEEAKTARIRRLNDQLRTTFITGNVFTTPGFRELSDRYREEVITRIRAYDEFDEDNDPYGEHDFGALYRLIEDGSWVTKSPGKRELYDCCVFWKIDYYDHNLEGGSEDPSDIEKTRRVLTIYLAEEH